MQNNLQSYFHKEANCELSGVIIEQVTKTFGQSRALDRVSLEIHNGEFLTVLGPSGSGKTTLLRLIAGLERPDTGHISIDGRVVCAPDRWLPPQQRGIGMVFQNYALWPHLTAFENVAFPLEAAGQSKSKIAARVREVMTVVELTDLEKKRPGEMSGGEQQRVALARALVDRPSILLMDECLSNLDARLREKMAAELRHIQKMVGITTVYVTHDQHEALALSDRIAVLHQGALQQVDKPDDLYHQPHNALVAASLGAINLISLAEARRLGLINPSSSHADNAALVGIRPENIALVPAQTQPDSTVIVQLSRCP
jgi:iron(III) transport system ATP-binding protein/putative spermidine/putrescine transport system ATP-binding protein